MGVLCFLEIFGNLCCFGNLNAGKSEQVSGDQPRPQLPHMFRWLHSQLQDRAQAQTQTQLQAQFCGSCG